MPKIYQLKQSISALKQEGMSVSSYFTQLKSLWDELNSILSPSQCICGNAKIIMEQQNHDRAMEFLQGLHDSFAAIRSQILLMEPFPSTQRIYNLVRQEEKQQEINVCTVPVVESAALQVSKQYRPSGKRQRLFCDHCNRHGHTRATCYQIHGFPNKQGKSSPAALNSTVTPAPTSSGPQIIHHEQYNKLLALLAKEESAASAALLAGIILSCTTPRWIIDLGASNHICASLSFFSSYTSLNKNILVELPDGSHASVTHIGIVKFNPSLILKHVYYIPSFKFNLLSISQLTSQLNCDVIFSDSTCLFQDRLTNSMISQGRLQNGLYCLEDVPNSNLAFSFQHLNNFDLWHSRLGHPCNSRFQFMIK